MSEFISFADDKIFKYITRIKAVTVRTVSVSDISAAVLRRLNIFFRSGSRYRGGLRRLYFLIVFIFLRLRIVYLESRGAGLFQFYFINNFFNILLGYVFKSAPCVYILRASVTISTL